MDALVTYTFRGLFEIEVYSFECALRGTSRIKLRGFDNTTHGVHSYSSFLKGADLEREIADYSANQPDGHELARESRERANALLELAALSNPVSEIDDNNYWITFLDEIEKNRPSTDFVEKQNGVEVYGAPHTFGIGCASRYRSKALAARAVVLDGTRGV